MLILGNNNIYLKINIYFTIFIKRKIKKKKKKKKKNYITFSLSKRK